MQTQRLIFVGDSGSGKTTLATEHVKRFRKAANKPRYVVVLSKDAPGESDLYEHCKQSMEITKGTPCELIDFGEILRRHKRVYFEVSTYEPEAFLRELGTALFELSDALLVVDESQTLVTRNAPSEFLDLLLRGRKRNIHALFIAQSLKQRDRDGLNRHAINQASHLVVFRKGEPEELKSLSGHHPKLTDIVPTLARPGDGMPPEYAVVDKITGALHVMRRTGPETISE